MNKKAVFLFTFLALAFGRTLLGDTASEADLERLFAASRRVPLQFQLAELKNNPREQEALLVKHESQVDAWLKRTLSGNPLFPCDLPTQPGQNPKLVLSGEEHATPQAKGRAQELLALVSHADPDQRIIYGIEGSSYDNALDLNEWGSQFGLHSLPFPQVQGVEGAQNTLNRWVCFAEAGGTASLPGGNARAINFRATVLNDVLMNSDMRKAYRGVAPKLPSNNAKKLFALMLEPFDKQDKRTLDLIAKPNLRVDLLTRMMERGAFEDEQGWPDFMKALILSLGEVRYPGEAMAADRAKLKEMFEKEFRSDVIMEHMVDRRNVEMVANIGKLYCQAIKEQKNLYVTVGMMHLYGIQRLIKSVVPNFTLSYEVTADIDTVTSGLQKSLAAAEE